mmetsp:Transcript_1122/g.1226  ORF Transcript_1122/g.1226 Transcript_1122/m.1226 type:complete len:203 (+) Transcript_1122:344-952(+)
MLKSVRKLFFSCSDFCVVALCKMIFMKARSVATVSLRSCRRHRTPKMQSTNGCQNNSVSSFGQNKKLQLNLLSMVWRVMLLWEPWTTYSKNLQDSKKPRVSIASVTSPKQPESNSRRRNSRLVPKNVRYVCGKNFSMQRFARPRTPPSKDIWCNYSTPQFEEPLRLARLKRYSPISETVPQLLSRNATWIAKILCATCLSNS